jgi:ferredoxin
VHEESTWAVISFVTEPSGYLRQYPNTDKENFMTVRIDPELCTGCALCTDSVPDVFRMGNDVAEVINATVAPDKEKIVKDAAADCPAEAIFVE